MTDDNPLAQARDEARQRSAIASAAYQALKSTGALSSHRLIAYRCPRRCLLLDVINIPQGVILHRPSYKLSPSLNESSSNEAGRASNTTDGDRRWRQNTGFVSEWGNVPLNCDHVRVTLELDAVQADVDTHHAEMVVMSSGERCSR
jgi:hypothetical protein